MAETRIENLALNFQEVLTATVRLRANRQHVSDAESFRHHMREALRSAATEAQRAGYPTEDVKLAAFATVALLDESILNSRNPLFANWPGRPLQEEMFGIHQAGEPVPAVTTIRGRRVPRTFGSRPTQVPGGAAGRSGPDAMRARWLEVPSRAY